MHDCSREEVVFKIVGRGGDLLVFGFLVLSIPLQRGVS